MLLWQNFHLVTIFFPVLKRTFLIIGILTLGNQEPNGKCYWCMTKNDDNFSDFSSEDYHHSCRWLQHAATKPFHRDWDQPFPRPVRVVDYVCTIILGWELYGCSSNLYMACPSPIEIVYIYIWGFFVLVRLRFSNSASLQVALEIFKVNEKLSVI